MTRTFSVFGHEGQMRLLSRLGRGRVQALLFVGPDGVGRRRVAAWYGALLNCSLRRDGNGGADAGASSSQDEPCGRCPSCIRAVRGEHPDYREVRAQALTRSGRVSRRPELRIDELVERKTSPVEPLGPWLEKRPRFAVRVGVIDGADTLTEEAANAFLKTLEEPPSYSCIILIAPSRDSVLATIASRCTVIRFAGVHPDTWLGDEESSALAEHPSLRLARPGDLIRAKRDLEGVGRVVDTLRRFLAATGGTLEEAFAATRELEDLLIETTDIDAFELLRGLLSRFEPASYARGIDAADRCEAALARYVSANVALKRLALELRQTG